MLPLVLSLLIILPSPYLSKWIGQIGHCNEGYHTTPFSGYCQPVCNNLCLEHAVCIEPNVCKCMAGYTINDKNKACMPACQLGYFWTPKTNSCMSICDDAYIWNAGTASCEQRCKSGISWDAETRTCVQKLKANVELIVEKEVNKELLLNIGEVSAKVPGDGVPEVLLDLTSVVGSCNSTNCGAESKITICLSFFIMLTAFGMVALLMAVTCLGNYFWKRRVNQQVEVLNAKNLSQEEYMLNRSQIMVY